jgi:c-di-GMP-binding flagellar brake protein YcgR
VGLTTKGSNPLSNLSLAHFVELSIRDRGVPFFAYVTIINKEYVGNRYLLTLSVPAQMVGKDSRNFKRIRFPDGLPITCSIVGVRGNLVTHGRSFSSDMIDICGGGISFVTSTNIFHPLYLLTQFTLPNSSDVYEIHGEVARITPFKQNMKRVSLSFSDATESDIRKIDDYCINYNSD